MPAAQRTFTNDIIAPHRSGEAIDYGGTTSFDARMLTVQDELTLLARARQLDPEALARIHDTYYSSIFRYVSFRVNDHATAEDLTSEVFTRLLAALRDKHAPQNTLRGWLYGVAARVVSDHHRQAYRAPQVELDESLSSADHDPADIVDRKLTQEDVKRAMRSLTEEQRQVLSLRFGSDLPIQDVARTLGKSEGAVKQLQARAVAALARQLAPKAVD
jgi:RNA polymerase sigma-70 factor (ECF subfamily)